MRKFLSDIGLQAMLCCASPRSGYGRHFGIGLAGDPYETCICHRESHFCPPPSCLPLAVLLPAPAATAPPASGTNAAAEIRATAQCSRPSPACPLAIRRLPTPEIFTTTGPLVAEQQADVAAERDGRVVNIAVRIGDHVRRASCWPRSMIAYFVPHAIRRKPWLQRRLRCDEWEAEELSARADLSRADIMRAEKIRQRQKIGSTSSTGSTRPSPKLRATRADEVAAEADLRPANLQLEQSKIVAPFAGVGGSQFGAPRAGSEERRRTLLDHCGGSASRALHRPRVCHGRVSVGAPLELTTADYPATPPAGPSRFASALSSIRPAEACRSLAQSFNPPRCSSPG